MLKITRSQYEMSPVNISWVSYELFKGAGYTVQWYCWQKETLVLLYVTKHLLNGWTDDNEIFGVYFWRFKNGLDLKKKLIQPAALSAGEVISRVTLRGSSS